MFGEYAYNFFSNKEQWIWINKYRDAEFHNDFSISIISGEKTDYFFSPLGDYQQNNAPCMYLTVKDNFTASVKLTPEFRSTYDAGGFLIMGKGESWVKFAFELTDMGYPAVVSVVNVKTSDDANGVPIKNISVWLQVVRKDNSITLYYSEDGKKWNMSRHFAFPMTENIKLGFTSQSPTGEGMSVRFSDFFLQDKIPDNIRSGSL